MKTTKRIGTFGVAAGLIVAAAGASQLAGVSPRAAEAGDGILMGTLVGRSARVEVMATGTGTRYQVRALDGTLIAANLTATEVGQLLPGQDPRGVFAEEADAGKALMLAEPRHFERD